MIIKDKKDSLLISLISSDLDHSSDKIIDFSWPKAKFNVLNIKVSTLNAATI